MTAAQQSIAAYAQRSALVPRFVFHYESHVIGRKVGTDLFDKKLLEYAKYAEEERINLAKISEVALRQLSLAVS